MEDLIPKTKKLSINIIKDCKEVPYDYINNILIKHLVRSVTSVGVNYRAYARARSKNEANSKMCIVVEEADGVAYWLEITKELGNEFEVLSKYFV